MARHPATRVQTPFAVESMVRATAVCAAIRPECPTVETVITAREAGGSVQHWRVAKPACDNETAEVEI